ncbi:MAG: methyltransferase domain-containing protein [Planctomycetota bacterium]|nr:MAG: methyltransferase domain-containing protein [Planctomycetota bacterium]
MRPFFVLSSARAGSTSLARILDSARNGCCLVEPSPNLNRETRLAMDGRLENPGAVVRDLVVPRVRQSRAEVHGEKNVTYGPFIGELHQQLNARFVLLTRDGRDVVRSLIDWHDRLFGTVYREAVDAGALSAAARQAAGALPVHLDSSDFARPRPQPGEPMYERWTRATRFEMCSYYWSRIYELYLDELEKLPEDAWVRIDYTTASPDDVLRVAEFLELEGLERDQVQQALDARINSLRDRCNEDPRFPAWTEWDGALRRNFDRIAGKTMRRLGYTTSASTRWKPRGYGQCWNEHGADLAWYEWMYDGRRRMHEEAIEWIRSRSDVQSVMDFGCGLGVGYCEALSDLAYIGVDIIEQTVRWCQEHRDNPRHRYEARDFIADPPRQAADLVMSSGTIDNAYDPEAYLDAMITASKKWVYLTCYRGWFDQLDEHRFTFNAEHGCFYADLSPQRVREHLERRGCTDIVIEPRKTGRTDIPAEMRVIAHVPQGEGK